MSIGFLNSLASFSTSSVPAKYDAIDKEIRDGLKNEVDRMSRARVARDYYEGNFAPYMSDYSEILGIRVNAPNRRSIPYIRSIIDAKIRRLYMADPKRVITGNDEATDYLAMLYSKGRCTPKLKESVKYAALGGVCAIQVEINQPKDDGEVEATLALARPAVNFRIYSADEFAVWCSPDEPLTPYAVAVLDRYDNQTRCRLWTPESFTVYTSKKWDGTGNTAGTRIFELISTETNILGLVPFAFQFWVEPTQDFWVWSPGEELARVNEHANARLCKIADDIIFTRPITYSKGVEPGWAPPSRYRATDIVPLPSSGGADTTIGSGIVEPALETTSVDLSYLEHDRAELESHLELQGEMHGVPQEQWRMRSAASGVAIVSEQLPIIEECEARQVLMESTEKDLALVTLMTVGAWLNSPAPIAAALADFDMSVQWPPLMKNRPGPDFDNHIRGMLDSGLYDPIQAYMEAKSVTREEAYQHFAEAAENKQYLISIGLTEDPQQQQQGQQDQQQNAGDGVNDNASQ